MSTLLIIILATTLVSLVSFIGVLVLSKRAISDKIIAIFVSLAAGVMIGAAFFDLLPEAFEMSTISTVLTWTLVGIVVAFLMERSLLWYHHHHEHRHTDTVKPSAYLILFGDGIHNFVDGVAITAAFLASPIVGIATTVAIIAHEIPQELADYSVLISSGLNKKKAMWYNFLSAVTAIIGAIVAFYFLSIFNEYIPLALAFTAGMFIYIALADLIPELHHAEGEKIAFSQTVSFIGGILLLALITSLTPHSHEHDESQHMNDVEHQAMHEIHVQEGYHDDHHE